MSLSLDCEDHGISWIAVPTTVFQCLMIQNTLQRSRFRSKVTEMPNSQHFNALMLSRFMYRFKISLESEIFLSCFFSQSVMISRCTFLTQSMGTCEKCCSPPSTGHSSLQCLKSPARQGFSENA